MAEDLTKLRRKVRQLRADLKLKDATLAAFRHSQAGLRSDLLRLQQQVNDKEDKLLPQKQQILKELAYLTNATARAVRTTMWSLTPGAVRRF